MGFDSKYLERTLSFAKLLLVWEGFAWGKSTMRTAISIACLGLGFCLAASANADPAGKIRPLSKYIVGRVQ